MLNEYPNSKIYVPLGIGNHFDHIEVFLSSLMYMVDNALHNQSVFYEDFYGMISTKIRNKHYIIKSYGKRKMKKPERSSFKFFIITNVMSTMISEPSIETFLEPKYKNLVWKCVPEQIKDYEEQKIKAINFYESQVKLFGIKHLKRALEVYHRN
ncbi:MAG: hypothetical protein ACTSQE_11020 [Candidatus Heimdallarchaeaceae archaeon]